MITLTPPALKRVREVLSRENDPTLNMRIKVKGGGCSGMTYELSFDVEKPGDEIFEHEGLRMLVDLKSYLYINGLELDYVEGLMGAGFKFKNPNVRRECSCGTSFSL